MRSRTRSLFQLGVLVFTVAICLYVYMTWFMFTEDKINKLPLNMPIDLIDGSSYQASFSPNYSAAYFVCLHFDSNISDHDLSLSLKEQDISINWSLKSFGRELSSNMIDNTNHATVHLISKYQYTLDVCVEKGSQKINELSPAITVLLSGHKGPRIRNETIIRILIIACLITAGGLLLLSGLLYLLKTSIKNITNRFNRPYESTVLNKRNINRSS